MAKRGFNWRPVIVLLISLLVLAVTTWRLRSWQRNRMAYSALNTGLKAFENHLWKDAAGNLGIYLTVDPADIEILHKYAHAHLNIRPLKQDNIRQAIATYRRVLRIDKNNTDAASDLIGLYLQINIPAEAELIAARYLQRNQDVQIDTMLAIALAEQRQFKKAAKRFEKIIDVHPQQIGTYEILGKLTEQYSEIFYINPEHWFNKAVTNNPDSAYACIIRAAYYLRKNQIKKAVADLQEAEKFDLSEVNTRFRLANELTKANMLEKAEVHLNKIQAINPQNTRLWQARATLALKTNSKQDMANVAQSGLKELEPDVWDFMPAATELFIESGKFEPAKNCIQKLQQRDIEPAAVAYLRGLLAESLNQNHKAIMCWRQAEQLGEKSERVRLELANAYWLSGDNQSAIFQLRILVSEKPSSFKGHLELARRLAQMGKWTEVEQNARQASTIAPNNIGAALLLLRAQIQLIQEDRPAKIQQIYKKMQSKLSKLDNIAENTTEVKLLKFQLAIKLRQFSDAVQMITELKNAPEKHVEIGIAEVDLRLAQNETNQAIAKLYSLIEQFPQEPMPLKYLTSLLVDHLSRADCEKLLKEKIQQIQNNFARRDLGLLLANLYTRWEQEEKACEMLTELVKQLPSDIPLKRQLLQNSRVKKDKKWAQKIVNQIKAIEGEQGWQWRYEQAKIWFEEKNFDNFYPRIVALLKKNLSTNPADQTSRVLLAKVFEKAGDLQLAVTTYRESLNHSPDDITVIVSTIAAMYKAEEYEQADEILNRITTQKLTNPQISKLQLQNCLRHGRLDSAEVILEELKAKNPGNETINLALALVKMRQGKFEQVHEMLKELKARNPKSFPISAALIELNICQKNNDQAISLCNELVTEHRSASAHILRAKTYLILGQNKFAKKDFDKAVAIDPDNIQAWIYKSDYDRSMGQIEAAAKAIKNALAVDPDNLQIRKRTIALLLSSRQSDKIKKGAELLNAALSANPSDIELKLFKAQYLLSKAIVPAIEQAQNILQNITIENPKIAEAWILWSKSYLMQAQSGKAIDAILSGLKYSPSDKSLLLLKARTEAIHTPKLAIPTLQQLFETEPGDIDVALELAKMYIAANQCDKCIALLQDIQVRCHKKDRIKIDAQLAVARYRNGEKTRAMQEFDLLYQSNIDNPNVLMAETSLLIDEEKLDLFFARVNDWLQKNPNDMTTLLTMAKKLAKTKNDKYLRTAETLLRKVLDRNPNCLKTMKSLAMLLQITKRPANAEKIYRKILTERPDDAITLNNLAWIMCEENGDYRNALQLAQKGLRNTPQYVDLIDTRGVIYYRTGKLRESFQDFSKCIELYPQNSPALTISHFHLARTLIALGQNYKAVGNLKKTLEFNSRLGGLSPAEINETEHLLKELLKEENYESVTR